MARTTTRSTNHPTERSQSRQTASRRSSPLRKTHQRAPSILGRLGEGMTIPIIIAFIIGLIVLIIGSTILTKSGKGPVGIISKESLLIKSTLCMQQYTPRNPTVCTPSITDRDGDCLPDTCDFCVDTTKPPADPTSSLQQQAAGSNLFDTDRDSMPDLCDSDPTNPQINTCSMESTGGIERCKPPAQHKGPDGKRIELASLGSKKLSVDTYIIA